MLKMEINNNEVIDKNNVFIQKAQMVHGNKYNYSNVNYINNKTKVIIICNIHGEFLQFPLNHINNKSGCPKCVYDIRRKTIEQFIHDARDIHGDKYDYSNVHYVNANTEVIINCNIHGDFLQSPFRHINKKSGCPDCTYDIQCKTTEQFIRDARDIHGDKYDYSNVNYVNACTKVRIICNNHGSFLQSPSKHINSKCGCPECAYAIYSKCKISLW